MPKIIEAMPGQIAIEDPTIKRPERVILGDLLGQHDRLVELGGDGFKPDILMPYSFSTFAAASIAGVFSRSKAFEYASVRADMVRETEDRKPETDRTAMAIVVGSGEYISELIKRFSLDWTNDNLSVQVVAGRMRDLAEMAKTVGNRFKGLLTAEGAYHCEERNDDSRRFGEYLKNERFANPHIPLISSTEPRLLQTGEDVKSELVALMRRKVVLEDILKGVASFIRGDAAGRLEVLSEHLIIDISPESTIKKLLSGRFPVNLNIVDLYTEGLAGLLGATRGSVQSAG